MSSTTLAVNTANSSVEQLFNWLFGQRDIRTKDWFLSVTPEPLLWILGLYLFFCLYAGPRFMRNRQAFELKGVLLVYNAIQVVLSGVMCHEFYKGGWGGHYNYRCQPISYDTDPISMRMARATWLYYMAKLSELLDTVFFVLRKRDRQISTLHVYHHVTMPVFSFIGVLYYADGHGTLLCLINSFVHVIMYSYYLLAAMGPKIQKYLWWKRYITRIQLIQFVIVFVHNFQLLFQPKCNYPKGIGVCLIVTSSILFYMFSSFYIQNYKKVKK